MDSDIGGIASPARFGRVPIIALAGFGVLTTVFAFCQAGYFNSDFIAYVSTAHRLAELGTQRLTGHWSPLFAWCMVPLIWTGLDDLVAGRLVLIAAGVLYVVAIFRLASLFERGTGQRNGLVSIGLMTCAVFQATVWSTYVLDPDLLAASLVFLYFSSVLDPQLAEKPARALGGGMIAGLAYLAKAYMLPFVLVQLPVTLLLRHWMERDPKRNPVSGLSRWLRIWALYAAGQFLVAGPWIALLTAHYGQLTISTAGTSSHANVSPENYAYDPLWNPGLVADYIEAPRLGPDWSPLQDRAHFFHQLKLTAKNVLICSEMIVFWLVLVGIGAVAWFRERRGPERRPLAPLDQFGVWWCFLTSLIYCGGYALVIMEARYIAPVVTPLVCLCGLLLIRRAGWRWLEKGARVGRLGPSWFPARVLLFILLFLPDDLHRLRRIAMVHPQSCRADSFQPIVRELEAAGLSKQPLASNGWHLSLAVAYVAKNIPNHLGAPLSQTADGIQQELAKSPAKVYLRWIHSERYASSRRPVDDFVPLPPWKLVRRIGADVVNQDTVREVAIYKLDPSDSPQRISQRPSSDRLQ